MVSETFCEHASMICAGKCMRQDAVDALEHTWLTFGGNSPLETLPRGCMQMLSGISLSVQSQCPASTLTGLDHALACLSSSASGQRLSSY